MRLAVRIQRQCQRMSNLSDSPEAGFVKGWLLPSRGAILPLRVGHARTRIGAISGLLFENIVISV